MANVDFHSERDGSLTAAKGSSRASFCWHFETPGAVKDRTTHNKPDLLASSQAGIWKPDRTKTNHQNLIQQLQHRRQPEPNIRPYHNTTTEKREPAATTQKNYYPPPAPTGSGKTRPGQKFGRRRTSPEKKGHKKGPKKQTNLLNPTNPTYYLPTEDQQNPAASETPWTRSELASENTTAHEPPEQSFVAGDA
ncbi:hypothetical protein RHMOL_Rhmol02G0296900 [Rhododendron molle]|uniref:Uncharacterized protein n=1 Tax=Rhododendron molle TaxID=49168 RepID=A0ACC0PVA6_RHOML|nr:hypothetical protein RHMOL_Rhmol02G0296900 [Rhododendron molle]